MSKSISQLYVDNPVFLPAADTPLETGGVTLGSGAMLAQNVRFKVATIAALKALVISNAANGVSVLVQGYAAAGDGGGGEFYYSSASAVAENGGTVIAPTVGAGRWLRMFTGKIFGRWFGMSPASSAAVNATALQAAVSALSYAAGVSTLCITSGTYDINATVAHAAADGVTIEGTGFGSVIRWTGANYAIMLSLTGTSLGGLTVRDISFDCNNKAATAVKTAVFGHVVTFERCLFRASLKDVGDTMAMLDNFVETHNGVIRSCWFFDGTSVAIGLNIAGTAGGPVGWTVEDCEFQQVLNWCLKTANISSVTISGNVVDGLIANVDQKGFYCDQCTNLTYRGNYMEGVAGTGLTLNPVAESAFKPQSATPPFLSS